MLNYINNNDIEIIAEIAQGYEGNTKLTELLTTEAIESGDDAVKYQLVFADELATPDYKYYDLFKSLEMSTDIWKDASNRIHDNGQNPYFDVFGFDSLAIVHDVEKYPITKILFVLWLKKIHEYKKCVKVLLNYVELQKPEFISEISIHETGRPVK